VDALFSVGAYERIVARLRIEWLVMVFFGVIGAIGTVKCLQERAPEFNLLFALFALAASVGAVCGIVILNKTKRWRVPQ
jgi:hypothetical protein